MKRLKKKTIIPPGLHNKAKEFITLVLSSTKPIMIIGETGVGKTIFFQIAELIYKCIKNENIKIAKVDCCDYSGKDSDSNLAKVNLFGCNIENCKGLNFNKEVGFFEYARGGIIFLDEIGELSESVQSMLLTFVESGQFIKFGDNELTESDVFIIAATNHQEKVRKELLSRFHIFRIPPIRERREDILYYLSNRNEENYRSIMLHEALPIMCYNWPNNVREIEDVMDEIDKHLIMNIVDDIDISKYPLSECHGVYKYENSNYNIQKFYILIRELSAFSDKELFEVLANTDMFVNSYKREENLRIEFFYEEKPEINTELTREGNIIVLILEIANKICKLDKIHPVESEIFLVTDDVINRLHLEFIKFCSFFLVDPKSNKDIIDSVQFVNINDDLLSALNEQLSDKSNMKKIYLLLKSFYENMDRIRKKNDLPEGYEVANIWWLSFKKLEEIYYKGLYEITKGSRKEMRKISGISENTLLAKIKLFNIE